MNISYLSKESMFRIQPWELEIERQFRGRFKKATLGFFVEFQGPFYVKGNREYLSWLQQRWPNKEEGSSIQNKLIPGTLMVDPYDNSRLRIFGRKITYVICGERDYIQLLAKNDRWSMISEVDLEEKQNQSP